MRGDSVFIFVTAVSITAGLIAAAWYLDARNTTPGLASEAPTRMEALGTITESPAPAIGEAPFERRPQAEPGGLRKCTGPDGQLVITDQPNCENLDLKPGLSVIDAPEYRTMPQRAREAGTRQVAASADRADDRPRLRDLGKPPPRGLNVECRWLVGRAGEVERMLGEAKNPAESIWKQEYCDLLREVRKAQCRVPSDQFYFARLCPY